MQLWKTAALLALISAPISAQISYPGCSDLTSSDFKMTELFSRNGGVNKDSTPIVSDPNLAEPTRMDVEVMRDPDGIYLYTNVYLVERKSGNVKFYDGAAKKISIMGTIPIHGLVDNSLMGMVLAPDFTTSRWMYFWYSPPEMVGQNRKMRLTRIHVDANNKLEMATEKILIEYVGSKTDRYHSGGPMEFDSYGDLWIAVGNNSHDLTPFNCNVMSKTDSTESAEWGSSNTASMRGGFLRIHPDESAKGYSIPEGNFGDYWAKHWDDMNYTGLAAEYRDTTKVLPEVYVKGERSNYSIAVHPTKRWLAWGTVNYGSVHDEFNITDHPIFSGFPYFHGNNEPTCDDPPRDIDPLAPRNTSPLNSGVVMLPPAIPPLTTNLVNIAIGGPIYVYDANLKSDVKFPPHFHNKWFTFGFGGGMWMMNLDSTTLKLNKTTPTIRMDNGIFSKFNFRNVVNAKFGSDGALYINNYGGNYDLAVNPGVMRITYQGDCVLPSVNIKTKKASDFRISLSPTNLIVHEKGPHEFSLYGLAGNQLYIHSGKENDEYRFTTLASDLKLQKGIYIVRVKMARGAFIKNISIL